MPRPFVPHKSGVHRAACFALYRALLRQINRLRLSRPQQTSLETRLRDKFHKGSNEQSPPVIIAALHRGYKFLEILHDASDKLSDTSNLVHGSTTSPIQEIISLPLIKPPPSPPKPLLKPARKSLIGPRVWPLPNTASVYKRPFPLLSGRRHIPYFTHATGFPFLRFRKPQSPFLSRLIRDHIDEIVKRNDRIKALRKLIQQGQDEDMWDRKIEKICGVESCEGEGSWTLESKVAMQHVRELQEAQKSKKAQVANKMLDIVHKEKALASKERAARKHSRHRGIRLRKSTKSTKNPVNPLKPPKTLASLAISGFKGGPESEKSYSI